MKQWWAKISVRERIIVSLAALVSIIILLDSLVLEPYRLKKLSLTENIEQAQTDLLWMQQSAHRLSVDTSETRKTLKGSLITFVNQQITRFGLKQNMQQMTPLNDQGIRLRLTDVPFQNLLKFFQSLENTQLQLDEVRLIPSESNGVVGVSVVVSSQVNS